MYRHIFLSNKPFPKLLSFITNAKIKNAKKKRSAEIADGSIALATNEPKIKLPDINMEKATIKPWLLVLKSRTEFFIFALLVKVNIAYTNSVLDEKVLIGLQRH